jgi:hypothetical protein
LASAASSAGLGEQAETPSSPVITNSVFVEFASSVDPAPPVASDSHMKFATWWRRKSAIASLGRLGALAR